MLDKTNRLMPDPRFLDELFEAGAHLFPLVAHDDQSVDLRARGKRPLKKGWNRWDAQSLMRDEVEAHMRAGRNIGERLRANHLVLDIDPRHFANGKGYSSPDESIAAAMHAWESFCAELAIDSEAVPIFLTGTGLHIRLRNPEGTAIVTRIEGRPGFEVRSSGGYIVAPGSVHAETGRLYMPHFLNRVSLDDAPEAPRALCDLLRRPVPETPAGGGELDPRILVDLLEALDPADFREHDKWFSLMCACHHATNGDGEDEFLAWSAQDPMYAHDIGVNRDRWRSLRSDKPGIATVATLYQAVSKAGRADLILQPIPSATDAFPDDIDPEWLARDVASEAEPKSDAEAPQAMRFTPYAFKDPSAIPPRDWLMKPNYIRQFATGTLGHGGVGKSILLMVEAVALASGQPLLGMQPYSQFRWLYWNGEDPIQELDRRFAAIRKHHDLSQEDLDGWLFVDSGRVLPIDIVTIDPKTRVAVPRDRDALIEALQHHELDGMTVDPFVSCHSVPENANEMIEEVAEAWNDVAERANVAIHISHHAVKARGRDVEAMDYRGGGAALAKLRNLRVLNGMTEKEAKKAGIEPAKRRYYFRADDSAKANLLPPAERTEWYTLVSVDLENRDRKRHGLYAESDKIGVPEPWNYVVAADEVLDPLPDDIAMVFAAMGDEPWRMKSNSPDRWVGIPIAQALGLDIADGKVRLQLNDLIARWDEDGVLIRSKPDKRDAHGNLRDGYVPGELPRLVMPDLSTEGNSAK